MKISRNTVASISFTAVDEAGQVISRTEPGQPLVALIGRGFLLPGLEKALDGHEKGDEFSVTLNPADSYGDFDPSKVQTLNRSMFGDMPLEVGYVFEAETPSGGVLVTVKEVRADTVVVDANHPYAGKVLTFLVEVNDVREATAEEKQHGHAHVDGHCPSEGGHRCCHHHDGEDGGHCCHHHDGGEGEDGHCCHHHDEGDEDGHCCCHHHDDDDEDAPACGCGCGCEEEGRR